ncbi:MAG: L-lactate permease [Desulfotomaculaceae bacterium]
MQQSRKEVQRPPRNWVRPAVTAGFLLVFFITAWLPGGFLSHDIVEWVQNYAPVGGNLYFSALLAGIPIFTMFLLLGGLKKPAHVAAIISLAATLLVAITVWKMPVGLAFNSTMLGMLVAVFPILWTLSSAVWIFNMTVESGYFEVVKNSLGYVSKDRRIQTLLVGFGFTTLLEGIAAFGAPIAIVTAMLLGFGFPPLTAATVALLADTTPSVWGTQGMPVVVLSSVTDLNINELSAMSGMQAPVLTAFFPVALVILIAGWKGFKEIWPLTIAVGFSYAIVGILISKSGPYIVGIAASLASILTILFVLRFWRPKSTWLFPGEKLPAENSSEKRLSVWEIIRAWSPYLLLIGVIGLVTGTPLKKWLTAISTVNIEWPGLHNVVWKLAPVVPHSEPYAAVYSQPVLVVGGSLVFLAGIISVFVLGIKPAKAAQIYISTLKKLLLPGVTIVSILGVAYLMNYAAMTYTIGLAFAATGFLFPVAVALMGMLGCTLAGSVAASNALFGNLSVVSGAQLGIDPVFSAGTLASGGTMGKAIAFQDLVIASATLNKPGIEGELLRRVFGISLIFVLLLGALAMLQLHVF